MRQSKWRQNSRIYSFLKTRYAGNWVMCNTELLAQVSFPLPLALDMTCRSVDIQTFSFEYIKYVCTNTSCVLKVCSITNRLLSLNCHLCIKAFSFHCFNMNISYGLSISSVHPVGNPWLYRCKENPCIGHYVSQKYFWKYSSLWFWMRQKQGSLHNSYCYSLYSPIKSALIKHVHWHT